MWYNIIDKESEEVLDVLQMSESEVSSYLSQNPDVYLEQCIDDLDDFEDDEYDEDEDWDDED